MQIQGCRKAEIIPLEPDPGNAGEGSEMRIYTPYKSDLLPRHYPPNKRKIIGGMMELTVSRGIIDTYFNKLKSILELDVAIVGAGPSGLVAARELAKAGKKVALFESKLAPGGGMWGGAMFFNQIVVQNLATSVLDEFNIQYERYDDTCVTCDSVHATSALIYAATKAGAIINNGFIVEDVVFQNEKVAGVVVNWGTVIRQGLHVDPLVIMAKCVLDATGHPCEVTNTVANKNNIKLNTPSGKVQGERSLSVEEGEEATVLNTKEVYPGLFVSGMAANGVSGSFRMGPIFGGMLLSGKKVANLIMESLEQ